MRALASTKNTKQGRFNAVSAGNLPPNRSSTIQMVSSAPNIQPAMKIGQPGDKYEQEADHVADQVMRMPDKHLQMQPGDEGEELQMQAMDEEEELQMKCRECEEQEKLQMTPAIQMDADGQAFASPEVASQIQSTSGRGTPLSSNMNREMSGKIGVNFSNVSIHAGQHAAQLNEQLGAKAFTHGNDIYFGQGQYNPTSSRGKHLLAHELTHVVQQNGASYSMPIQRQNTPPAWCDPLNDLVEYEDQHGRLNTLIEYNSFDNEDLVPLNHNIPSIYGDVDVDWMLRLAFIQYPFIIGSIFTPSMSEGFGGIASRIGYLGLKSFWITIDPRTKGFNWDSLLEEGNWNSSTVITNYIHGEESLRDIFAPGLTLCQGSSGNSTNSEPTY